MEMEGKDQPEEAGRLFLLAWNESTNDFEKFLAAYYVARHQENPSDKLKWYETSLQFALKVNNEMVNGALATLYANIAKCYEDIGDADKAIKNYELAESFKNILTDKGPFYHGTKADLKVGDLLIAGNRSKSGNRLLLPYFA
jgi:rifampin ADP-ribosylating transferase